MILTPARAVRALMAALFYGLLGIAALYSLWFNPGTVGDTLPHDYYHVHWGYWWIRYALSNGLPVYQTDFVHFPYVTNLAFHTLSPFWYPIWAVLEPLMGTIAAMNAIMSSAIVLAGLVTYGLLRRMRVQRAWALAGGAIFALTPTNLFSAMLTNVNYLGVFWLPLSLIVWERVAAHVNADHVDFRRALLWTAITGVTFYGLLMTEYQLGVFVAVLLLPYGLHTLLVSRRRTLLTTCGLLAVGLSISLFWLAGPLPYILSYDFGTFAPQPIENAAGIPFPLGFVTRLDPYSRQLSLGWLILPTVLAGLIAKQLYGGERLKPRPKRFAPDWVWASSLAAAAVLAAGPQIELAGRPIVMPYVVLHEVFGGLFRVPARFAPVAVLAALLYALPALSDIRIVIGKDTYQLLSAAFIGLVMIDGSLFIPMPVRPALEPYKFHQLLREERGSQYGDYVVIDVPVAGGSGEAWVGEFEAMETQFFGTVHEKRMLNGTFARAPLSHFWYWLYDDPMLAWLGQRRWLEPASVEAQLSQRIAEWPIGYIVVRQDAVGRDGPTSQEIIGFLNQLPHLVCPLLVERDAVLYRSRWHPSGCPARRPPALDDSSVQIDVGSPGDELYLGWGWHRQENISGITLRWAGEYPQADLYVELTPGVYRLTMYAQAFAETRSVWLLVNDDPVGQAAAISAEGLAEYSFGIPPERIGQGVPTKFSLVYDTVQTARQLGISEDARPLSVAVDWIRFSREQ